MALARRITRSRWFDPALAVALFAIAELESAANDQPLAFAIAIPFFTLTLAVRRQAPLAITVIAAVALAVADQFAELDFASNASFVALFVMTFGAGAHLPRREALLAIGSFWVWLVGSAIVHGGGELVFSITVFTVPWLAGRGVRAQRQQELAIERTVNRLRFERERNAELAVAAEQLALAREVHDTVAGQLNLVIVQVAVALQAAATDVDAAAAALATAQDAGRAASADLRRMVDVLRSPAEAGETSATPRLGELETLVALARGAGLDASLTVTGDARPLAPALELSAYRIVQEALNNAARHARGARADVHIRYTPRALEVEVRDDGGVPAPNPSDGGHGLLGMRERVAVYEGEFEAGPVAGGGFALRARLPLQEAHA